VKIGLHKVPSPSDPSAIFKIPKKGDNQVTEDDILYLDPIFTFNDTLSEEDAEKFAEYLMVPYLSIPLVLSFFSDNRVGTLLNNQFRNIFHHVLFQPKPFHTTPTNNYYTSQT